VGGSTPASHKELTSSKLFTCPPPHPKREILPFEDTQLGVTLSITLCWENEKGRLDPPSPIQGRVIA
jgi:hypothetical protein